MANSRSGVALRLVPAPPRKLSLYSLHDDFEFAGARMTYLRAGPLVRTRKRPVLTDNYQPMAIVQLSGNSKFRQFDREVALGPGSFVFFDGAMPCQTHIFCESDRILIRFPHTAFTPRQIRQASTRSIDTGKANNALFSKHVPMLWETLPDLLFDQHGAALSAMMALALLTDPFSDRGDPADLDRRVRKIQDYIECRLDDERLDAKCVADVLGLSRRYVDLIFREATGYTIAAWIWERRLQRAREQLKLTNFRKDTVTTVAFDIGFKSPSHFSRLFKKRFGLTPVKYRNIGSPDAEAVAAPVARFG